MSVELCPLTVWLWTEGSVFSRGLSVTLYPLIATTEWWLQTQFQEHQKCSPFPTMAATQPAQGFSELFPWSPSDAVLMVRNLWGHPGKHVKCPSLTLEMTLLLNWHAVNLEEKLTLSGNYQLGVEMVFVRDHILHTAVIIWMYCFYPGIKV